MQIPKTFSYKGKTLNLQNTFPLQRKESHIAAERQLNAYRTAGHICIIREYGKSGALYTDTEPPIDVF